MYGLVQKPAVVVLLISPGLAAILVLTLRYSIACSRSITPPIFLLYSSETRPESDSVAPNRQGRFSDSLESVSRSV